MKMTGQFRLALLPGTDPEVFEQHMVDSVFTGPNALQLTRITTGFDHQLLVARKQSGTTVTNPNPGGQYVWLATVDVMTSAGYDFDENGPAVQEHVKDFAVLVAIESYVNIEA